MKSRIVLQKKQVIILSLFLSSLEKVWQKAANAPSHSWSKCFHVGWVMRPKGCGRKKRGWEREREIREEEELRGRGRWRKPRISASAPTGWMNERLETWIKLKSIVQHTWLWVFGDFYSHMQQKRVDQRGKCIWQLFNASLRRPIILLRFSLNFTPTILDLMSGFWLLFQH